MRTKSRSLTRMRHQKDGDVMMIMMFVIVVIMIIMPTLFTTTTIMTSRLLTRVVHQ